MYTTYYHINNAIYVVEITFKKKKGLKNTDTKVKYIP